MQIKLRPYQQDTYDKIINELQNGTKRIAVALPTGGGKSLTFQLPTFLQPGLCLVVDPIKSLMEDQVRVLKLNWIDCCDFINSNLKREEKVKKLNKLIGNCIDIYIS